MDWVFNIGFTILGAFAGAILANQTLLVWVFDLPKLAELHGKNKLNSSYKENTIRTRAMVWVVLTVLIAIASLFLLEDPSWFLVGMLATFLGSYMNAKAKPERLEQAFKEKYKQYLNKN